MECETTEQIIEFLRELRRGRDLTRVIEYSTISAVFQRPLSAVFHRGSGADVDHDVYNADVYGADVDDRKFCRVFVDGMQVLSMYNCRLSTRLPLPLDEYLCTTINDVVVPCSVKMVQQGRFLRISTDLFDQLYLLPPSSTSSSSVPTPIGVSSSSSSSKINRHLRLSETVNGLSLEEVPTEATATANNYKSRSKSKRKSKRAQQQQHHVHVLSQESEFVDQETGVVQRIASQCPSVYSYVDDGSTRVLNLSPRSQKTLQESTETYYEQRKRIASSAVGSLLSGIRNRHLRPELRRYVVHFLCKLGCFTVSELEHATTLEYVHKYLWTARRSKSSSSSLEEDEADEQQQQQEEEYQDEEERKLLRGAIPFEVTMKNPWIPHSYYTSSSSSAAAGDDDDPLYIKALFYYPPSAAKEGTCKVVLMIPFSPDTDMAGPFERKQCAWLQRMSEERRQHVKRRTSSSSSSSRKTTTTTAAAAAATRDADCFSSFSSSFSTDVYLRSHWRKFSTLINQAVQMYVPSKASKFFRLNGASSSTTVPTSQGVPQMWITSVTDPGSPITYYKSVKTVAVTEEERILAADQEQKLAHLQHLARRSNSSNSSTTTSTSTAVVGRSISNNMIRPHRVTSLQQLDDNDTLLHMRVHSNRYRPDGGNIRGALDAAPGIVNDVAEEYRAERKFSSLQPVKCYQKRLVWVDAEDVSNSKPYCGEQEFVCPRGIWVEQSLDGSKRRYYGVTTTAATATRVEEEIVREKPTRYCDTSEEEDDYEQVDLSSTDDTSADVAGGGGSSSSGGGGGGGGSSKLKDDEIVIAFADYDAKKDSDGASASASNGIGIWDRVLPSCCGGGRNNGRIDRQRERN